MNEELVRVEELRRDVAPVVQQAAALVVSTPQEYEGAANFLKNVKAAAKKVTDFFDPIVATAHAAWKKTTEGKATLLKPLADAEATVKRKMIVFQTEQERIRQQEQARLQAQADEAARRERERLEKEAARLKTPEKKEERLAQAAAVAAPVVTVASAAPVIAGQSLRKTWKARIVDPKAAATEALAFPDWQAYITINQGEFNKFAARTKGAVQISGVEFYEDTSLASSAK